MIHLCALALIPRVTTPRTPRPARVHSGARPQAAFKQFGDVEKAVLDSCPITGQSRGWGFIQYADPRVAAHVYHVMSENLFMLSYPPRPVRVRFAELGYRRDPTPLYEQVVREPTTAHWAAPNTLQWTQALELRELALTQESESAAVKLLHKEERAKMHQRHVEQVKADQGLLAQIHRNQREETTAGRQDYTVSNIDDA